MMVLKRIICLNLALVFVCFFGIKACAENTETDNINEIYDELTDSIEDGIDEDIQNQLKDEGIELDNPSSVSKLDVKSIFNRFLSAFSINFSKAMKLVAKLTALILLCALINNYTPQGIYAEQAFSFVSILVCISIILASIQECLTSVVKSLAGMNIFMNCYIPVYSSVLITGGNVTSGTAYHILMFSICEFISVFTNSVIMPVMSIALCFSITGALNCDYSFGKVISAINNLVKWLLGGFMTITVAILGMQSVIGASTDTLATKTAKYAVSTFVPIIGGAVSEAFLTVKSSVGVIRSGIGGIGMLVVLFTVIKPIALIFSFKIALFVAGIISDLLEQKSLSLLFSDLSTLLSIALSIIVAVSVVFIISTALLMIVCNNSI